MTDAELVLAAQGGDSEAFGELVKCHEGLVSAVAIAGLSSLAMVEDVVQDSFVAAWVHRDSLKDPDKFRPWVCGIARNLASKARRSSSNSVNSEQLADSAAGVPTAEDHLIRIESENALSSALQEIPVDQREILVLFYREEQSVREVSRALGLSEAAAQKRISRARKSVKNQMSAFLETGPHNSVARVGFGAGVLAIIHSGDAAASVSLSASQAATTSAAPLSTQIIGGILTMKAILPAAAALTLLIGGAVVYSVNNDDASASDRPDKREAVVAQTTKKVVPKKDRKSNDTSLRIRRIDADERAARFAKFKQSASSPNSATVTNTPVVPAKQEKRSHKDIIKSTIQEVKPLLRECYDMSEEGQAGSNTLLVVGFHISNEPEIAGLVTEFSLSRSNDATVIEPSLIECMEETFMSLEFVGMDKETSINYPFLFGTKKTNSSDKPQ